MWWKSLQDVWGSLWKVLWIPGIKRLLKAYLDGMEHWMTWLYLVAAWGPNSTHMRFVSGHEITGLGSYQEWLHKRHFWPLLKLGITWSNFPVVDWSLRSEPWKCWNPGAWRKVSPQPGATRGERPSSLAATGREGLQTGLHIVLTAVWYPGLYGGWIYLSQVYGNSSPRPRWY